MGLRVVAVALFAVLAMPLRADVALWNNGPIVNAPFTGAGGAHTSHIQGELGLISIGFVTRSSFPNSLAWRKMADDFVIDTPGGWHVSRVTVFAMPGSPPTPQSVTVLDVSISLGAPWDGGAIVFTGRSYPPWTPIGAYRVFDAPLSSAYPIEARSLAVDQVLPPGHYWLIWGYDSTYTGYGSISPPVTRNGVANTGDARFSGYQCSIGGACWDIPWTPIVDSGNNAQQGLPFVITGRPVSARKGDFDGQNGPDLLFRNVNPQSPDFNRNKLWFMDGATRIGEAFVTPDPPGAQWTVVGSDDFDTAGAPWNGPDGKTDLLLRDAASGALEFWLMDGASRVGAPLPVSGVAPPDAVWQLAATGDFNADGRPDLVWRHSVSQKLVIWTMNGTAATGALIPTPDQAVDGNWAIVAAQDYNDDGFTDFLWYNSTSGKIVSWYMDQALQRVSGQFVNPPNAGNNNWKVLASGDYSGPAGSGTPPLHSPDVVWRNETSGRLVVWHLDFASTRVFGEFTSPDANTPALDWTVVGPK